MQACEACECTPQVLELTQGQQVESEILTVLVQQVQAGRQAAGVDGQDTKGEPAAPYHLVLYLLAFVFQPCACRYVCSFHFLSDQGRRSAWQLAYCVFSNVQAGF